MLDKYRIVIMPEASGETFTHVNILLHANAETKARIQFKLDLGFADSHAVGAAMEGIIDCDSGQDYGLLLRVLGEAIFTDGITAIPPRG